MCSNDVLKERVENLLTKLDDFIQIQTDEHKLIFEKFEALDDKYPTRREFKAVKWAWWVIVMIIWLLSTLWIISK